MKYLQVKCESADKLSLDDINPFQGNLKDLSIKNYEKLRAELIRHGYSEPISVWKNPQDGKWMCLNGHQRLRALKLMREDGFEIPQLPVSVVECRDWAEAKEKVLALASQYGEVTWEGLNEFLGESGIDLEYLESSIRLPEIDIDRFINGHDGSGADRTGEVMPDDLKTSHKCPRCGFEYGNDTD